MRTLLIIASAILSCSFAAISQADNIGSKLEQQLSRTSGRGKVSQTDAAGGIKEAMAQGVKRAITQLGREDGFNKDPFVRILIPKQLRKISDTARQLGAGKKVDQFELSMNRAAEKAIPAADIFADAVRQMTVQDAISIVRGDEDAGTQFFRRVTEDKLRAKFMPIVADATARTGVTKRYKEMAGKNSNITKLLGGGGSIDLDRYVTDEAMDGLYHYVAEQEKDIRKNPLKQSSDLLRRVFGK
ncbi:MAG: DUF4197 domain-containing protein [Arenimonas sp.]